jgi:hypothetical protein
MRRPQPQEADREVERLQILPRAGQGSPARLAGQAEPPSASYSGHRQVELTFMHGTHQEIATIAAAGQYGEDWMFDAKRRLRKPGIFREGARGTPTGGDVRMRRWHCPGMSTDTGPGGTTCGEEHQPCGICQVS